MNASPPEEASMADHKVGNTGGTTDRKGGHHVQGAPHSQHDIPHDERGATKIPDASKMEQGTKAPEVRDAGDKADKPKP
jgi:hypothetical protein